MTAESLAATSRKLALLLEQAADEGIPADRLVAMLEGAAEGIRWEHGRAERERRERARAESKAALWLLQGGPR